MKVSIIIPVYNSHRIVRRQIKHFNHMHLSNDIEVIFMDDGSSPPLKEKFPKPGVVQIYPTGDSRKWSQPCAKNLGARIASGEYLLITDIDHILSKEIINEVYNFTGDKMEFKREYGILNNRGVIVQTLDELLRYGFNDRHYKKRGFRVYRHTNTFAMKRKIFFEIGGYAITDCDVGKHPTHDDVHLFNRYKRHVRHGKCKLSETGGVTYVFPTKNQKLFHDLDRTIYRVASTRKTIYHLAYMLEKYKGVHFLRFGDTELRYMRHLNAKIDLNHKPSIELRKDLIGSFMVKDKRYIKSVSLLYEKEIGMKYKFFALGKIRTRVFEKYIKKISDEKMFYNPIAFHYLSVYDPKVVLHFIDTHIRSKKIMFIGGNDQTAMEQLYGPIDCYIQTPKQDAYYNIKDWWPEIERNISSCDIAILSIGAASSIVQKRFYDMKAEINSIDIGSISDVLENNATRGWIKKAGVDRIKSNLLESK